MCTSAAAGCLFSLVHCLHCTTPAPKKASGRTRKSRFAFFWLLSEPSSIPLSVRISSPRVSRPRQNRLHPQNFLPPALRPRRRDGIGLSHEKADDRFRPNRGQDRFAGEKSQSAVVTTLYPTLFLYASTLLHVCVSANATRTFSRQIRPVFPFRSTPRRLYAGRRNERRAVPPSIIPRYFWLSAAFSAKKRRKRGGMKKFPDAICLLFARFVV